MADVSELAVRGIEARIDTNIATIDAAWTSAANVAWSGANFDPGSETGWMRPIVLFTESEWGTMGVQGTGKNVVAGILQASFFIRPGTGLGTVRAQIANFRDLFDRLELAISGHGAAEFDPAGAPRPGPFDGSWEQLIVDCSFTIEEHGS